MHKKKYPLIDLIPYLGKYRYRIALGFLMVILTVIAQLFSPWILGVVVEGLKQGIVREKLPRYAALILGVSVVEGFFRFWMRRILIGVSRVVEYDLRNDFLAHVQKMSLSYLQSRARETSCPGRPMI